MEKEHILLNAHGEVRGVHICHPHAEQQQRGRAGACEGCGHPTSYLPMKTGLCAACAGDVLAGQKVGTEIWARYQRRREAVAARRDRIRQAHRLRRAVRGMEEDGIPAEHQERALASYLK